MPLSRMKPTRKMILEEPRQDHLNIQTIEQNYGISHDSDNEHDIEYPRRIPKGETKCERCGKRFSNTHTLRKHVRETHHLKVLHEKPGPVGSTKEEKKRKRTEQLQKYYEHAAEGRHKRRIKSIAADFVGKIDDAQAYRSIMITV